MNRKQKIIVTVTGIFVVLLALLGLTFAYFLTQIRGNEETKSISVTTANLILEYKDGNGIITLTNLMPGDPIQPKTFAVANKGDSLVENYKVYLEDVHNGLELKDDLTYTLTCKQFKTTDYEAWENSDDPNKKITDLTEDGTCTGATTATFPSVMTAIATNSIADGYTQHYELQLEYKYQQFDQSIDMNKLVQAKVNIYDGRTKFLATEIMNDTRITKNTTAPAFTGVETAEKGLYPALDDYGTSYYFRGAQSYNYVNFAGFIWRIVRINGDGSIRLILNDGLRNGSELLNPHNTYFNNSYDNNAYVGYMYGYALIDATENVCVITENNSISIDYSISNESSCISANGEWINSYDATHDNITSSNVKQKVDDFYVSYLKTNYANFLSDNIFCGDKELAAPGLKGSDNKGYSNNVTYYAASERLTYDALGEDLTVATPTLKCANNADNDYSRYTVNVQELKNITTNGDLDYPIGLISADEIVFAGGWNGAGERGNSSYYLNITANEEATKYGSVGWWSMTPKYSKVANISTTIGSGFTGAMYSSMENKYGKVSLNTTSVAYPNMIRPVINLKADISIVEGDGTSGTPYIIK